MAVNTIPSSAFCVIGFGRIAHPQAIVKSPYRLVEIGIRNMRHPFVPGIRRIQPHKALIGIQRAGVIPLGPL